MYRFTKVLRVIRLVQNGKGKLLCTEYNINFLVLCI